MLIRWASSAASLAGYHLADGVPRAYVGTGRHRPHSSLTSSLEASYHIQNCRSRSPTLVRVVKGIWCPSGVSLTREEHENMGIVLMLFIVYALLLLSCVLLPHEARMVADIPQYAKIDQRARKLVIASTPLNFQQNDPYAPCNMYCTRSPWHDPWLKKSPSTCPARCQA